MVIHTYLVMYLASDTFLGGSQKSECYRVQSLVCNRVTSKEVINIRMLHMDSKVARTELIDGIRTQLRADVGNTLPKTQLRPVT